MPGQHTIAPPVLADAAALWRLARDSRTLDLNSPYAYALWCRDFAGTSVVAKAEGRIIGFVTGYRRPSSPDVAMVWLVAVDPSQRRKNLAAAMLDDLVARLVRDGVRYLETTIAPGNDASIRLFASFATRWNAPVGRTGFLAPSDFPSEVGAHEPEELYRIGPLAHDNVHATVRMRA
ncbi:diaminobutyrate acetyltransferase [Amycolatopsis rubida]|uniref:L-2,4-diaminobutyric acid acetyltransferase n=1 Tax=Amycolatopsis rubida TaxID=112413 RepID=A0ABX0BUZ5_9PSEU|nr:MULTISPECIES: diaminobutyrate acetyltransferase [Amycolatopsis]MYW93062.1 diaminobutyrate acetyltransferase [Amycolatopsis rubida]NEC58049.1 diaminobutyrate acetyltransferase [Amycolatopsis rubida]OAP26826.1 L-2,4-diaminobutyric acid acetyltransferase [Amycolatopsis sp. M39]